MANDKRAQREAKREARETRNINRQLRILTRAQQKQDGTYRKK